ncbi:MAG: response regulator [Bacillota bacterium]|nr:response regulator [Bacillota bacterium]
MCKKILIADDEAITRFDIKEQLEDAGYQVVGEAADGFDAIELCRKHRPDLLLLDIKMPLLDGLSAARIIKEENLCHCIIMTTAYSDRDFVEKAGEYGVMGYLVKPMDNSTLIPTIEVALKRSGEIHRLQQESKMKDQRLEDQKLIARAKGFLMEDSHMTEREAYDYMRKFSMDKRKSMREVAELVILNHKNLFE